MNALAGGASPACRSSWKQASSDAGWSSDAVPRSGGGLFYRGYAEFAPALRMLVERADLQEGLGEAGRAYVAREYDWDIVERRTQSFLERIAGTPAA